MLQQVERRRVGYHSRWREQAFLRDPVQGNQGTGEPGQVGHQASRMPEDRERAQGHYSQHSQANSQACSANRIRCKKPPLMGHHNVDRSLAVVAMAAQKDHQQQQDTSNQTGAAHQELQDLQDRQKDCKRCLRTNRARAVQEWLLCY